MYKKTIAYDLCKINSNVLIRLLVMFKISLLLLMLSVSHVGAKVHAQKASIKAENTTLKKVFNELRKQTGYHFLYLEEDLKKARPVSLDLTNTSLETILDYCFKGQPLVYEIRKNRVLVERKERGSSKVLANLSEVQPNQITGKVTNEKGEPLQGVTVNIKGTSTFTTTNNTGNYQIDISNNQEVLVFTIIGYSDQEKVVGSSSMINVTMKEFISDLDEVVVVGYGTQKKLNVTGAVAQITSEELKDRPVANLSQMMQGALPNLNVSFSSGRPGSSGGFNIRGNTSINGGRPLVLIDGIEGNIDRLNPNDVESVSILKDASASAIYGGRASFGVILVTTKQGKKGDNSISYNVRNSFSKSTTSTDYETRGYYSAKINDDFFRSYAGKNYTKYSEDDYYQLWIRRHDVTEHPDRPWVVTDQRDGRDTYVYYANTNLYDYLYDDNRPTWEHNVNFSGGNDAVQYFLSGNYFSQKGIIKPDPDQFKSYNFRANLKAKVKPWLDISNNTKYFASNYEFPGWSTVNDLFDFSLYSGLASFVPVNPDGTAVYTTSLMDYRYAEGRTALLHNGYHHNADIWDDFSTTFESTFKVVKDFNIKANYSFSKQNYKTLKRSDNLDYSKYPGEYEFRSDDIGISRLSESRSERWYHATNIYGNYLKEIDNHSVSLIGGFNYETQRIQDVSAMREGLLTKDLTDFNLATGDVMDVSGGKNKYAIMGGFYRLNYSYLGRYLFEASGRYDGSSRFKRGYRFGFFPSASAGWRVSSEPFFEPLKSVIDDVKIRYSYGVLGNQQIVGYYDYLQLINTSGTMNYSFGEGSKAPYSSVSAPNAGDLTWERVITNNIGIDMTLLKGLTLTADAYIRDTKDMLTKGKTLPGAYGAAAPKENAADLRTKGWELAVTWNDSYVVADKPFRYKIGVGLSDYISHITKFDNPTRLLSDYYVGQKLGDMWGYHVDGFFLSDDEAANYKVDQTAVNNIINSSAGSEKGLKAGDLKYLDLDGDEIISFGANTADKPGDRTIIGNSQPRYAFGVNLGASWNGIDFSAFFQGIGKQHWYPAPHSMAFWNTYSRPFASFIPRDFMNDVWSEENPNAYFPRPRGYTAMATNRQLGAVNNRYLQDLAYWRLKNLTVGYTVPSQYVKRAGFKNLRVYFSGENLFTITKLRSDYIDPEQATGSSGTSKVYPWAKTYAFGIDVSF